MNMKPWHLILMALILAIVALFCISFTRVQRLAEDSPSVQHVVAGGIHYVVLPGCPTAINVTQDSMQIEFLKQSQLRMALGMYPAAVEKPRTKRRH